MLKKKSLHHKFHVFWLKLPAQLSLPQCWLIPLFLVLTFLSLTALSWWSQVLGAQFVFPVSPSWTILELFSPISLWDISMPQIYDISVSAPCFNRNFSLLEPVLLLLRCIQLPPSTPTPCKCGITLRILLFDCVRTVCG